MTLAAPGGRGGGASVGILRIMRRGAASSDSNVILTDTGGDGPPADAGAKASVARVFASDALGRDEPISMRNTTGLDAEYDRSRRNDGGRRRRAREAQAGPGGAGGRYADNRERPIGHQHAVILL